MKAKECQNDQRKIGARQRFKQDTVANNLMEGEPVQLPHMDGLVDIGDGRILSGGLKIDIGEKKVVCCSFDSEWRCLQCEQHKERSAFKIRGIADSSSAPQVVILADQSFPACLPSGTEKDCVKILIMEGGSLKELVEEFFSRLGNRRVPPGSAVLLFSMSWLADTGVVGYAEELIAMRMMIQDKLGKATRVLPLPPVTLGGTDQPAVTRSIFELTTWSLDYFKEDRYFLEKATLKAKELLLDAGKNDNMREDWEHIRLVLPCATSKTGRKIWSSGGSSCENMA
jgi:hypothetical protein